MQVETRIVKIPIDSIIIPPNRFTSVYSNINWLCNNMLKSGFILPIVVKKDAQRKRYVLIDGYNRLVCLQKYKIKEVPAIVVETEQIEYVNMLINLVRGKRCGWYVLQGINQLLSEGVETDKIATLIGRSKGTIKNYITAYKNLITKLSQEDIQLLIDECISIKTLITCSKEDNPMDCIMRRVREVNPETLQAEKIARQIATMVKHAIKQGADPDLLIRRINEVLDEVLQLSVNRHEE